MEQQEPKPVSTDAPFEDGIERHVMHAVDEPLEARLGVLPAVGGAARIFGRERVLGTAHELCGGPPAAVAGGSPVVGCGGGGRSDK